MQRCTGTGTAGVGWSSRESRSSIPVLVPQYRLMLASSDVVELHRYGTCRVAVSNVQWKIMCACGRVVKASVFLSASVLHGDERPSPETQEQSRIQCGARN